ncbi:MAG TPA: hypothetical protein VG844_18615 [Terracidiphilus sp.]|jgi:hypothetical protein|nr:hypothetical protein [Terracidiphilus sp.]
MKKETYRAACDQARSELRDIVSEMESLRVRKEQIERMISVLEPLSGPDDGLSAQFDRAMEKRYESAPVADVREFARPRSEENRVESQPVVEVPMMAEAPMAEEQNHDQQIAVEAEEPVQVMAEGEPEEVFQGDEASSDPIKRRIANALRHRAVLRDNREFNQAFSGGITRW